MRSCATWWRFKRLFAKLHFLWAFSGPSVWACVLWLPLSSSTPLCERTTANCHWPVQVSFKDGVRHVGLLTNCLLADEGVIGTTCPSARCVCSHLPFARTQHSGVGTWGLNVDLPQKPVFFSVLLVSCPEELAFSTNPGPISFC